jgi:hypothetical protein
VAACTGGFCGRGLAAGFGAGFRATTLRGDLRAGRARLVERREAAALRDFEARPAAARRRAGFGLALRAGLFRALAALRAFERAAVRAGLRAARRLFRFEPLDLAAMWTTPLPLVDLGC